MSGKKISSAVTAPVELEGHSARGEFQDKEDLTRVVQEGRTMEND